MDVGVELSFYPLQQPYLEPIRALLERLHAAPRLRVVTTSLSTQLFGDYDTIMALLVRELRTALAGEQRNVVLLKLLGPLEEVSAGPAAAARGPD